MAIAIILAITIFIIVKFTIAKNEQASKITMEGGMKSKYEELISILMSGDPRASIVRQTKESLTVGLTNSGGTTLFVITQTFGNITIQWKVDSPVFGRHQMEWDFPEYDDQSQMADKIMNDLGKYQQNLVSGHGL